MDRRRELSKADLENVKHILFMGLDFVSVDLSAYLKDYIKINRKTFTDPKIGGSRITEDLFDAWIDEWYDKRNPMINDCLYCERFFDISKGWNSEYCSQTCRDLYFERMDRNESENRGIGNQDRSK